MRFVVHLELPDGFRRDGLRGGGRAVGRGDVVRRRWLGVLHSIAGGGCGAGGHIRVRTIRRANGIAAANFYANNTTTDSHAWSNVFTSFFITDTAADGHGAA